MRFQSIQQCALFVHVRRGVMIALIDGLFCVDVAVIMFIHQNLLSHKSFVNVSIKVVVIIVYISSRKLMSWNMLDSGHSELAKTVLKKSFEK